MGPTSASGTSACAVAAAAVKSGRAEPDQFEVRMDGGSLEVSVTAEMQITLTGPVQEVATGSLTIAAPCVWTIDALNHDKKTY